jgi:putative FmdB family regulatory protein
MPTYEYVCSSCSNEWEYEQSIKDSALTECPRCHEQTARRQISRGTGFILKGGGWYADLYSSGSNKGGSSSPASGSGSGSSGGDGSSGSSSSSTPSTGDSGSSGGSSASSGGSSGGSSVAAA